MPSAAQTIARLHPQLQDLLDQLRAAASLYQLSKIALAIGFFLARLVLTEEIDRRADLPVFWPPCRHCGTNLRSRGWLSRKVRTLLGEILFARPVGRCPRGCAKSSFAPLDLALGLRPRQRVAFDLREAAVTLVTFVTFQTSCRLLSQLTGQTLSTRSLSVYVRDYGSRLRKALDQEVEHFDEEGQLPALEPGCLDSPEALLILGADGFNVRFRPNNGSPHGKSVGHMVLAGVVAIQDQHTKRNGEVCQRIVRKRFVTRLCSHEDLQSPLQIEACRQGLIERASERVQWISDGLRWLWEIFEETFAVFCEGTLDFPHNAKNLNECVQALYGEGSEEAKAAFKELRHMLRHETPEKVLAEIKRRYEALKGSLSKEARKRIQNYQRYLRKYKAHSGYARLKREGKVLGSGFVEASCKQQQVRFKGPGMRWSKEGFRNLAVLRDAQLNGRLEWALSQARAPT